MISKTMMSFDEFVHTANSWPNSAAPREYLRYLNDEQHVRRLLAAVDAGLVLTPFAISSMAMFNSLEPAGREHFRQRPGFDDDDLFTPTRFDFVFQYHRAMDNDHEAVMAAAGAQLDRMFAAGRVASDIEYLGNYMNQVSADANREGNQLGWVPLVAHFDTVREIFESRVARGRQFGSVKFFEGYGTAGEEGQQAQVVLNAAGLLRERMFREGWLRSALSDTEWCEVRKLALPVLQDLYAEMWAAGYAGYNAALLAAQK